MSTKLALSAGQYSAKGIKPRNEDACGIRMPEDASLVTKGIATVVADGVSGSEGGRAAAETCVQGFLSDYYSTPDSWTVKHSGQRVLTALNRWLHSEGLRRYAQDYCMLSTFSALVFKSTTAHLFHVGDTRVHRIRGGELECLTRDHQIWAKGEKAFLSRAMGADMTVDIDYQALPLEVGDTFVLTTDGVHDYLGDKELLHLTAEHGNTPERAARALVSRALERGSHDNATCQILHVEQLPAQNENEFFQRLTELPFPPPLTVDSVLDGYRILREIHASARTQVYLALDTDAGQHVVIKTPSVNYEDNPEYIDAFLHEEWAGRRINNPHVLKVIDPRQRRRFLYYVTEYVKGQTLRQWMNDHPDPPLSDVRALVTQIIAGVRAFQRQEMVHRDLKPENIMIDQHGTVKIVDFGSVKIAGLEEIAAPIERNTVLGTLSYAAPEYFSGHSGSHISDLYSVAVITYEMLTGHLPYGGALSPRNIKRVEYTPARQHNPKVPTWVDGALRKATQLNPERRYLAMSEFLHDLSHPNPGLVRTDPVPLLERNPVAFWRGAAILLLLANLALLFYFKR
ncbi:MAG TPA: bifunctional protein-serine/threonine kinase/phosphatase [Gammaproteobacteria bacterium]|nr:bifunctional protein-serine/threonine kinase/phosphatase [Gammaproteobacteria bacterium]